MSIDNHTPLRIQIADEIHPQPDTDAIHALKVMRSALCQALAKIDAIGFSDLNSQQEEFAAEVWDELGNWIAKLNAMLPYEVQ